jgi:hypothetical protein
MSASASMSDSRKPGVANQKSVSSSSSADCARHTQTSLAIGTPFPLLEKQDGQQSVHQIGALPQVGQSHFLSHPHTNRKVATQNVCRQSVACQVYQVGRGGLPQHAGASRDG